MVFIVAKLAGVPKLVIERAKILLAEYSKDERFIYTRDKSLENNIKNRNQLSFFDNDTENDAVAESTNVYHIPEEHQKLIEDIKSIDINHFNST